MKTSLNIRRPVFWPTCVAVMMVLPMPVTAEAQSLLYCDLDQGPRRPGAIDSTGGWWRVGSGPSAGNIRFIQGHPAGWAVYEAANASDVNPYINPLDTDVSKVIYCQLEDGSDAPGSCGGACKRWPEGITGYDESNPDSIYGYYVEERPVCTSSHGFEFVHPRIGDR